MQPFFANYLNNLHELHEEIRAAVKSLPQEALDWTPSPDMNSVNALVVHLAGAQRYWIGDVVTGVPSFRDRDAEFQASGLSADELVDRLDEIEAFIHKVLEPLTLPDLDAKRISPRSGREVTLGWALLHVLKHTALHVGHLQMTRQLWEQGEAK